MTAQTQPITSAPRTPFSWAWLGVVPFFIFAIGFLLIPSLSLFIGSFQDQNGNFTLNNIFDLFRERVIVSAYIQSIQISLTTALMGGVFGFFVAYAVIFGGLPPALRSVLITFSGVASNFAGVPLAFAFIATLGRTGLVTAFMKNVLGFDIYSTDFSLYNFWGLSFTYVYFQLPLMILIMTPALEGLRREWREAAENLGATGWQYWRHIGLPILLPSMLGMMILLFGNSFGAYATAYALTGGTLPLVMLLIGAQISGDSLPNRGLGFALALGMVVIMALSLIGYSLLQRRSERWLK